MGKIRRPLLAVCLWIVAGIALWTHLVRGAEAGEWNPCGAESGTELTVTGRVYQKDSNSITLKSVVLFSGQEVQEQYPQKFYIKCELQDEAVCEEIRLGSTVKAAGAYYDYPQAANPGEFDSNEYYRSLKIAGCLRNGRVLSASERYARLPELLYRLRGHWRSRLYQVFPQREASVMTTMLLGDKEGLDAELKELYRRNGMIHILSISGLHISIIGMGVYGLLRKIGLPPWLAALLGGGILLLYGLLSGMSVSACRAIGMYLIRMLAEAVGRTYDMLTALGAVAVILLLENPGYLYHQGFLLSFGAVAGIAALAPLLLPEEKERPKLYEEKRWRRLGKSAGRALRRSLGQSVCAGVSISLVTVPIQLWFYYEIPVYSLFLNLLILPFMSAVMVCGLLVMLLPGSGILGTVDVVILAGYEGLCRWFDGLPLHTWNPGRPAVWQMAAYYGLLIGFLILRRKDANRRRAAGREWEASGWIKRPGRGADRLLLAAASAILLIRLPAGNRVTFLDVGQGDGIVLETASGEVYLIDCGSSSRSQVGSYVLLPYLKYRGIRRIDAILLSHGDSDHYSGIVELLQHTGEQGIEIGELVLPAVAGAERRECFAPLFRALEEGEAQITVGYLEAGETWATKGAVFTCLHPPENYEGESNAASECIYVTFGRDGRDGSILFTGDVEEAGEELLVSELRRRGIRDISVLKVAHHGSRYSTGEAFLDQIDARLAVISCGRNNRYGHPHEELLDRLEQDNTRILQTPDTGAITILFKKGQIRATTQKESAIPR